MTGVRGLRKAEITTALALRSGFSSVDELLAIAQHGSGELVFRVDFVYHAPG